MLKPRVSFFLLVFFFFFWLEPLCTEASCWHTTRKRGAVSRYNVIVSLNNMIIFTKWRGGIILNRDLLRKTWNYHVTMSVAAVFFFLSCISSLVLLKEPKSGTICPLNVTLQTVKNFEHNVPMKWHYLMIIALHYHDHHMVNVQSWQNQKLSKVKCDRRQFHIFIKNLCVTCLRTRVCLEIKPASLLVKCCLWLSTF